MNKSGKVLTIFLVIAAVLLASLAAIAVFFFQMEISSRKIAEIELAQYKAKAEQAQAEAAELQKQVFLLQDKNKENDERINGLIDEVELQKGLRDELKVETTKLREQLDAEVKAKDKIKEQLSQSAAEYEAKIKELEAKIAVQASKNTPLEINVNDSKSSLQVLPNVQQDASNNSINLNEIIVDPQSIAKGRVLNVDSDTEFLIVDLGRKDNIQQGQALALYRGNSYLGDIKVSRVQDEMSAADFIPPLTSRQVRKNDLVVIK